MQLVAIIVTSFNNDKYKTYSHLVDIQLKLNAQKFTGHPRRDTQQKFTCSDSTVEILRKKYEICSKLTIKTPERRY